MDPLGNHIKAFKCCGIWTWPDQPQWYRPYSMVLCTLAYIIYPGLMLINMIVSTNLSELIEGAFFLPTALVGIKLLILISKKEKILQLTALIRRMENSTATSEAEQRLLRVVSEQPTRRCFVALWVVYILTSIWSYTEAQIMSGGRQRRRLMWPMWLPFDLQTCPWLVHQMMLSYQALVTLNDCLMHSSLDTFAVAMCNGLGAYLDVLGMRLERIGHRRGGAHRGRRDEAQLRTCIQLHYQCIEFGKCINEIMSMIFIIQFGMSGITLCGSEFQLSTVSLYLYFIFFDFYGGHFGIYVDKSI